ncbi:hypothetical protein STEG23_020587, partial [Scotinomys teguina]
FGYKAKATENQENVQKKLHWVVKHCKAPRCTGRWTKGDPKDSYTASVMPIRNRASKNDDTKCPLITERKYHSVILDNQLKCSFLEKETPPVPAFLSYL